MQSNNHKNQIVEYLMDLKEETMDFHIHVSHSIKERNLKDFDRIQKNVLIKLMVNRNLIKKVNQVIQDHRITQIYFNIFNLLISLCCDELSCFDKEIEKIQYLFYSALFYTNKV